MTITDSYNQHDSRIKHYYILIHMLISNQILKPTVHRLFENGQFLEQISTKTLNVFTDFKTS